MMKVISITGGVGSGKSEVLRLLREEFGARIIVADEIAHQLMEPGKMGYQRVVEFLGREILRDDGAIDRKKMADRIFKDAGITRQINSIIHPMVWQEIASAIAGTEEKLAVVEAALFDEEHNAMFDEIWYVYTSQENRVKRLMASRGYTEEKCFAIMKNQASEEEYRSLAKHVIDNNGTVEDLFVQLQTILKED